MAGIAALAAIALAFVPGCESGGDDGGGSSGASVIGKWEVVSQADGGLSWWQFNKGGTFTQYNDAGFSSAHLSGTFSQSGSKVTGSFTNPGVGDGDIDATVSGNTIQIDFIEHWHDPYKHVPLSGTRL